jgi:uncharacterized protein YuzE
MTVKIDKDADVLYIELVKDVETFDTLEISLDIYVEIDKDDNVIAIEVLNFSDYKQLDIPSFAMPTKLDDIKALSAQLVA